MSMDSKGFWELFGNFRSARIRWLPAHENFSGFVPVAQKR